MSAALLALIAFIFLGLFAISSGAARSVLAPAPVWNLMWFIAFITSASFGAGFIYDARAMLLLAAVAASFNVGCAFAGSLRPPRTVSAPPHAAIPPFLIVACLALAALGVVSVSKDLGTSILSVRSFGSLLSLGQQNAVSIFRGEASLGRVSKLAFSAMQLGFALVGAQWRLHRTRRLAAALVAFLVVAFMWSAVTTQRSYLLVPIVWFVGGYVAATCWKGQRFLPPRVLVRAVVIVAVLVVLVVWLRSVRTGGTAAGVSSGAFSSSLPWLAGYLPAFSVWYMNGGVITDGQVPGFFGGVTGLLGTKDTGQTGGNEYIGAASYSNAPTMMRDVFAVGGPLVAAIIVVLLGVLAHTAYRRSLAGRAGGAAMYASALTFILWAPNAWFFSYGGRVLAGIWLVLGGVVVTWRLTRAARRRTASSPHIWPGLPASGHQSSAPGQGPYPTRTHMITRGDT